MKKVLYTVSILIALSGYSTAQQNVQQKSENTVRIENASKSISNDQIFNDIMRTLSPEMKMKLDSTRQALKQVDNLKNNNVAEIPGESKKEADYKEKIGNIPKELKDKVEKTIKEIELKHQQRAVEFKERVNQKK
jgi:hypothetical protein